MLIEVDQRLDLIKKINEALVNSGAKAMSPEQFDRLYDMEEAKLIKVLENVSDNLRYERNQN